MKRLKDAPNDEVIRLLAQAQGIAQRRRMRVGLRNRINSALIWAFDEAERLRARKKLK